jgi:redox-sensitive bicupin YhaK (pirin superfamily)
LARVRVIAGEALGVRAVIDTRTPIVYQDWILEPGAGVEQPLAEGHHAFVYVFEGRAEVGSGRSLSNGELGLLGPGRSVRLAVPAGAASGARLLLLAGQPLREPVARYGPFVMNTESEIRQAVSDYRSGRFAEIQRA